MNVARPLSHLTKTAHSTVKRPIHKKTTFNNNNDNQRVNTVRSKTVNTARPIAVVNAVKGSLINAVKASACWIYKPKTKVIDHGNPQQDLQEKRVIDSRCSRHITWNMSYLIYYEEINEGYVAFGGNPKGEKITSKEAVNIACYVQNKVLVVKPYNKTPYELFHDRTPALSFMRPFGCPVTILNTKDHVGKFDGKADKGSLNSKAFRVFNSKTRIVEENLHIRFNKNTLNVVGSGPDWLFDIDALTRTMNYEAIVAGTQSNNFAGSKANDNAGQARKEKAHVKDYIMLPLWTAGPPFSQQSKSSQDDKFQPSSDHGKKVDEDPRQESECKYQKKEDNVNSSNNVNAASTNRVNIVGANTNNELPFDPEMSALEDISTFNFSMIGYLHLTTQTRHMSKNLEEHRFVTNIHQRTNPKDLQNYLFACFLSQKEPKKVIHALKDRSWIEAMQEELLQFKLQEVWTLVDLPNRKRAIGTKWVFWNKKNERGIVIRNKARLVAQGHTQEERIDYDKVFAHVARIEAIRLFLAYASFKDFVVYQIDVKSVFHYGKIKEEVYVCQPPGFKDPDFHNKVYKVEKELDGIQQAPRAWYETLSTYLLDNGFHRGKIDKTLFIIRHKEKMMHEKFQISSIGELTFFLGLQVKQKQDGIFISQDKYVAEILKKYGFTKVKNTSTPMETQKPLLKDKDGKEVDVHIYRSMIGSLMYLTSLNLDIMFALCACVRYQVNPKVSHLHDVKRIFRDLQLEDDEGVDCLPNAAIFEQLTLIGEIPLFPTMMVQAQEEIGKDLANRIDPHHTPTIIQPSASQPQKKQKPRKTQRKDTELPQTSGPTTNIADEAVNEEMDDSLERAAITASSLEAEQDNGNINKTQSKATLNEPSFIGTSSGSGPRCQETIRDTIAQTRVKKLEKKQRSRTHKLKRLYLVGLTARVDSSDEASLGEDASKQERIIDDIDADEGITLVDETAKNQGRFNGQEDAEMLFDVADDLRGKDVFVSQEVPLKEVNVVATTTTATINDITLAKALMEIRSAKPKADKEQAPTPIVSSQQLKSHAKGKAIMIEELVKLKKKDQIMLDEEVALKLQAKLQAEFDKGQRLAREKAQQIKEVNRAWDDIQAKMDVDYQLAQRVQAKEQEELTDEEKARLTALVVESLKEAKAGVIEGSSKRVGEEFEQENAKKQKI
nr:putative ribonuclease H-like domain-containing protein [Tanacetum cinerariifolium]